MCIKVYQVSFVTTKPLGFKHHYHYFCEHIPGRHSSMSPHPPTAFCHLLLQEKCSDSTTLWTLQEIMNELNEPILAHEAEFP